ncbi:putative zinc finger transcription factor ace1 [Rosellinia necatrix]|uniref:Putative zinc finger transcription factor ace1 n=1 Tax=Rosellinia necatrix TaxID=77044 RepID=A0A1W2TDP1_ROSNE|nr:putative zinc finger transcription factor ace1 [Rosellinia necatrix]
MSSNPRRTRTLAGLDPIRDGLKLNSNLALRKGATFHSPVTPPSSPPCASTFRVPSLPSRSQTNLDDVIGAHVRRAALNIGKVEDSLAASDFEPMPGRRLFRDDSFPVPRGFLNHTIMTDRMTMGPPLQDDERRVLRPRTRRSSQHHASDSGLGSSIASTIQKRKETRPAASASTITRSVNTSKTDSLPRLSPHAVNCILEHTIKPLMAKPGLEAFESIVLDCPRRIQENQIICLRDLEKTLIHMAPERADSAKMYLDFCLTSIRCIQATVEYLTDREQTRPDDRPYNNGYFIDLEEQIREYAEKMREARNKLAAGEDLGEMDVDPTDELKLVGGLGATGCPVQLVRVKKNGKAISLTTGELVEELEEGKGPVRFKRSMSEQAEDEEEIMRSMARRKKNATPEELAPKKCTHPGCKKEFARPCDLTKHEKTHSRPWKCPIPTCKYHDYGWPTEKEMARHVNDKHSAAPEMYECKYKPCPYKSKRESNCKQHMEKAHGWTYKRSKVPKAKGSKADSSVEPTPNINNLPTPSSDQTDPILTPHEDPFLPSWDDNQDIFPAYPTTEEFNADLFDNDRFEGDISLEWSPIDNGTPSTDAGQLNSYQELSPDFTGQFEDIYGAHVRMPTPPTYSAYGKTMPEPFGNFNAAMGPPAPPPHFSPSGQGNTMLYTPTSMIDVDEGFDDFNPVGDSQLGGDFTLFPPNNMGKPSDFDPTLFSAVPSSLTAGYDQLSHPDFMDFTMDWTSTNIHGFSHQQ